MDTKTGILMLLRGSADIWTQILSLQDHPVPEQTAPCALPGALCFHRHRTEPNFQNFQRLKPITEACQYLWDEYLLHVVLARLWCPALQENTHLCVDANYFQIQSLTSGDWMKQINLCNTYRQFSHDQSRVLEQGRWLQRAFCFDIAWILMAFEAQVSDT